MKKGQVLSMSTIVISAIALLVLVILATFLLRSSEQEEEIEVIVLSCEDVAVSDWGLVRGEDFTDCEKYDSFCFCYLHKERECTEWDERNNSKICLDYNIEPLQYLKNEQFPVLEFELK